jgi:small GTP-binding protein
MGCCCYSHARTEKDILRVAIFGLENSGKTSLVHCLKTSNKIIQTSNYISTHGVIAINVHLNIQTNLNLLIFDYGGCKHQRHIWPHLMNNSDVILFTVDSFDSTCLNDAKEALLDLITDQSLVDKPLLIVFTKSDKRKNININQLEQALALSMIQVNSNKMDLIISFFFLGSTYS